MFLLRNITLACCGFGLMVSAAASASATGRPDLSELQVERALEAIWSKTPAEEQRSPDAAKRAALESYLARLGPGTAIISKADASKLPSEAEFPPLRFQSELLAGNIGYIRLGAFVPELPQRLDPVLRDFAQMGARSVILDLRATPAQGTLALAVDVAGCFVPSNTPLFALRTSGLPPKVEYSKRAAVAKFRLVILTGQRTAGPVEALAAALRAQAGATLFGVSTRGESADFDLIPLGKDTFLRLAVREAQVQGAPGMVPDGVHPDIICAVTPESTDAALMRAARDGKVAPLLRQAERARLNEAALVAGQNPETEAWIQAQLKKGFATPEATPKDAALTAALDFLTAWESLYGRAEVLP